MAQKLFNTSFSNSLGQLIALYLYIFRTNVFVARSESESLMVMTQCCKQRFPYYEKVCSHSLFKCIIFLFQVKIAILQYLQGLIGLMDPSDFTNSGGILLLHYNLKYSLLISTWISYNTVLVGRFYVNFRYFKKIMVGKKEKLFLT